MDFKSFLKMNYLTLLTMAGVIIGIIVGIIIRSEQDEIMSPREIMYISFIGNIFLRMLKSIIIPLIIPSLIVSIGSLDLKDSSRIGGVAIIYYSVTTFLAVILGIVLVVTIQPGYGADIDNLSSVTDTSRNVTTPDTLMDLIRNCFPPNILRATIQQDKTGIVYPGTDGVIKRKNKPDIDGSDKNTWDIKTESTWNSNILGLIVFSIVLGLAIAISKEEGAPLLNFFQSLATVMMRITIWIIHLAPVGVCFLIIGKVLEMENFGESFTKLGKYFGTVLLGLFLHGFIVLPSLYALSTRKSPIRFVLNMGNALMTAFGTASSAATLPITMNCLEEKNGIDSKISRFVLPIGATINMDGTALYEAIAAIFIAQFRGVPLTFGNVIAISITATAASIGAAGIPQAGIVTMVMVLDTVGLPSEDVGLILAVDWLLDRFRTTVNVLGDSIGAGVVSHYSNKEKKVEKDAISMCEKPTESSQDNHEVTTI
ncbi:excitatory amino acid transporter 3 [Lepeophtheirus salmonis]|uniref:excitatory amino acid transporter 3 n=1 Tax=Lepeophtheirus salmonis TaxID=72036 RepID=UPI001AE565C6|nr:excitatory amino acid transporter 3-like [Lepeophtheirus salmonis]